MIYNDFCVDPDELGSRKVKRRVYACPRLVNGKQERTEPELYCANNKIISCMALTKAYIQAYFRDIASLVLDHYNKMNTAINESHKLFGFPVHAKVMFTLYYSLVFNSIMSKKCTYFN